jgi:hypothetical protein
MKKKQSESLFPGMIGRAAKPYTPETPDEFDDQVPALWDTWIVAHYRGHPSGNRPILNHSRWEILKGALKTYGFELTRQAIVGCAHSPWHSGMNPTGRKYNSLEIIFKSEAQVKKLAKMAPTMDTATW